MAKAKTSRVNPFNAARITRRNNDFGNTIFIPLPRESWVSFGKCACPYCKDKEGFWDTIALTADSSYDYTWTVHYPELPGRE